MKKKILHFFSIFSLIFVLYVSYEVTTISSKIVNRPLVVISISNVRNPQIKKLLRSFDNLYVSILLKFHNKSKLYFENKDKRDELPEKKLIKKLMNIQKIYIQNTITGKTGTEIMEIVLQIDFQA